MSPSQFARVLRAAADEAERVAADEAAERRDWIDQTRSMLGRRRHCAAVRRRVAAAHPDAAIVGRRYLLSITAHGEELRLVGSRLRLVKTETTAERLRRRLGIEVTKTIENGRPR